MNANFLEKEVLKKAKDGDDSAFEIIIREFERKIVRFAYGMVGNSFDAEDLAQEIFVKVYFGIKNFDFSKPFEPWLYAIARNHIRSFLSSKRGVFVSLEKILGTLEEKAIESEDDIEKVDPELRIAMEKLKTIDREIISLKYISELKLEEIAERLKLPLSTVKTKLRRGLKKLENDLNLEKLNLSFLE